MKTIFLSIALGAIFAFNAQVGTSFPELKGITLNDKSVTIPTDTKGKMTIICLANSRKAEDALRGWLNPAYHKFVAKTELMADMNDEINLYFVPMFTGVNQPTAGVAKREMKADTDKIFYDNIVCYTGSNKPYKTTLQITDKGEPYFFVLDKQGIIVYATSGVYSKEKMEEIEDKLE